MVKDFVLTNEKKVTRFLEILPGFLTWGLLLSPIWLGILYPQLIICFLTFLTIFWFYLGIKFIFGAFKGYKKYQAELIVKWDKEVMKLDFKKLPEPDLLPENVSELKH